MFPPPVTAKLDEGERELAGWPPGSKAGLGGGGVETAKEMRERYWLENPPFRWLLTGVVPGARIILNRGFLPATKRYGQKTPCRSFFITMRAPGPAGFHATMQAGQNIGRATFMWALGGALVYLYSLLSVPVSFSLLFTLLCFSFSNAIYISLSLST
jgi:hypothetical protein